MINAPIDARTTVFIICMILQSHGRQRSGSVVVFLQLAVACLHTTFGDHAVPMIDALISWSTFTRTESCVRES